MAPRKASLLYQDCCYSMAVSYGHRLYELLCENGDITDAQTIGSSDCWTSEYRPISSTRSMLLCDVRS